ncbi:MAG: cell surface protein SprA [Chlorobi bacterium]|nr:cell surface protein SprA [Chlorobiota bacterium]
MGNNNFVIKKTFFAILLLLVMSLGFYDQVLAQQANDTTNTDTTHIDLVFPFSDRTGNPFLDGDQSPLFLNDPSNIKREIVYNPVTNTYEFQNKIGNFTYRTPTVMDFDDFQKYQNKSSVNDYWNERAATTGESEGSRLIPKIYVGGEAFDKIFGSNTIDIRPQGSAEVSFGIASNRREDPSLDVRQRKTTNFDFNEKIQMNVIAKIGDKIEFKANYNTESSFDFENTLKLKYEGKEDEIIKLIEAGNVSLPLNSSLITGSQSLFGIKTELQFGKTRVTAVFSQQQSETQNITVQGGAQQNDFLLTALDYEENKHFFVSQAFRDNFEKATSTLPIITSDVNITKVEVWVTNIGAATQENRNIIAFTDLGEGKQQKIFNQNINALPNGNIPSNKSNDLLARLDTTRVRNINEVTNYLSGDPFGLGKNNYFVSGEDFVKLENARKLKESEYTVNSKLGFISLNTSLNPDQVLAVAVQYTIIGQDGVFQIGEFSDQGVVAPKSLIVKLLRSSNLNVKMPMWDLMMKNVYAIGAYQVQKDNFIFNILYSGDNQGVPTGYFMEGNDETRGVPLIHIFGLDKLDNQLNPVPGGDGVFDFIDNAASNGGTFQSNNGRLFFTHLEPFGSYLRDSVFPNDPELANRYAYDSLYTMTKTAAEQFPDKNKFLLEGYYSSSSGSDISLNALNVPQGSVKVTAGGSPLTENVDYTVDYTLGRVKIINEGVLNSGVPINVSLESNSMFNVQQKRMMGVHVDHEINKDFHIGGTLINLHERPLTQKVNYGDDPISNTIWGLDLSYGIESRWLTNMINKLPGISSNQISKINIDGEFAQFIPGTSRAVGKNGTSYIDDFEGAKSSIDLKHIGSWFLASTPQGQTTDLFPESRPNSGLQYGMNRSRFNWYIIDPLFYDASGALRPSNIDKNEISKNSTRQVLETEVFPNKDIPNGTPTNIPVFNLAFYPEERGPYNYDVNPSQYTAGVNSDGTLAKPESRWGGIMRRIESSDFEASNIEYIEFWMMDPFSEDADNSGKLYINLGEISEDILRDGRKSYENGLPIDANVKDVDTTIWGRVPTLQALVESFSNASGSRVYQDVGYEGLDDDDEVSWYSGTNKYLDLLRSSVDPNAYLEAEDDPSSDNYHYFRGSDYDTDGKFASVLERYKLYNGPDGNSPTDDVNPENYPTSGTTLPNIEDINRDNTLGEAERYYQYEIDLDPGKMEVGQNYITDVRPANNVPLPNGDVANVNWYQFKIPVQNPDKVVGSIGDFRSIRFMRIFMKGFKKPIVTRFATFELVRSEWRRYTHSLLGQGEYIAGDETSETKFTVSTVNIEENGNREPIPYSIPPGIRREVNFGTTNYVRQNEQSLELSVENLIDGDAKGVYKTTDFDFRQYKKIQMYAHAEKMFAADNPQYGDLTVFVRIGADFTHNYYEYELPLEYTNWGENNPELVWPTANRMEIILDELVQVKQNRNVAMRDPNSPIRLDKPYSEAVGPAKVSVVGNPSISDVNGILIGVRNPKKLGVHSNDDGNAKSAIVWVDELRLTDFNKKPGWAATGRVDATLADLGRVSINASHTSAGFGSIERKISEIPLESLTNYMVSTDLDVGKFFGEKAGVKIPVHVDYGVSKITPRFNPLSPDVKLKDDLSTYASDTKRDSVKDVSNDITKRTNINLMNVRKERKSSKKKSHIYDIENFDASFAYSHNQHRNIDIEYDDQKVYRGGLGYSFNAKPKNYKPFGKSKSLKSNWFKLIKDFNVYVVPKVLSVRFDMNRDITKRLDRDKSFGDIITYPRYNRVWTWNRNYDFRYDFSRSLNVEYNAGANAYIDEPILYPDKNTEEWQLYKDQVWREIFSMGTTNTFNQTLKVTYNLPLRKLPLTDWMKLAASYQGLYSWTTSPKSIQPRFGNTIENSNQKQLNGSADFDKLYNKWGYLKDLNRASSTRRRPTAATRGGGPKPPDNPDDTTNQKPKINYGKIIGEGAVKLLMSMKKFSVTYSENNGILLPGFMPQPDLLGMNFDQSAPGWGFVFGSQRDIRADASTNGWITQDTVLNNPYMLKHTESLSYKFNMDFLKIFKIDFNADRIYASNFQAYYRYDPEIGEFNEFSPVEAGNFSISYSIIKTSFVKPNADDTSPVFEAFKTNRITVAERLANDNPQWSGNYIYDSLAGMNFPEGYGSNSQEVLYYSFLSAYSGGNSSTIGIASPFPKFPIPNWKVSFNGLTRIKPIGKLFRSFNITHGYRSMLSISSWETNVLYDPENPGNTYEDSPNYVTKYDVNVISVIEQFNPLVGVDFTMHNSFNARVEYKKSRNITMSFVNNQMTEIVGNEISIGMGYRWKGLKFTLTSLGGSGKKSSFNSDLNLKLDFGIRDNKTTLRRIDEDNNQISAGSKQYTLNFSADYMLSQSLQFRAYFNWTSSNPYVSSQYPNATTNGGFTLRFNLAQ